MAIKVPLEVSDLLFSVIKGQPNSRGQTYRYELSFKVHKEWVWLFNINEVYGAAAKRAGKRIVGFKFIRPETKELRAVITDFMLKHLVDNKILFNREVIERTSKGDYPTGYFKLRLKIPKHIYQYKNGKPKFMDASNFIKVPEDIMSSMIVDDIFNTHVESIKEAIDRSDDLIQFDIQLWLEFKQEDKNA